jgi:hypothetical protein
MPTNFIVDYYHPLKKIILFVNCVLGHGKNRTCDKVVCGILTDKESENPEEYMVCDRLFMLCYVMLCYVKTQ